VQTDGQLSLFARMYPQTADPRDYIIPIQITGLSHRLQFPRGEQKDTHTVREQTALERKTHTHTVREQTALERKTHTHTVREQTALERKTDTQTERDQTRRP